MTSLLFQPNMELIQEKTSDVTNLISTDAMGLLGTTPVMSPKMTFYDMNENMNGPSSQNTLLPQDLTYPAPEFSEPSSSSSSSSQNTLLPQDLTYPAPYNMNNENNNLTVESSLLKTPLSQNLSHENTTYFQSQQSVTKPFTNQHAFSISTTFSPEQMAQIQQLLDNNVNTVIEALKKQYKNQQDKLLKSVKNTVGEVKEVIESESRGITTSLKKQLTTILTPKTILNKGIHLPVEDCYQRMKHNPLLHQVIFIMNHIISTKDGVVVTWPFKMKDNKYVFVTSIALLSFVIKKMFSKVLNVNSLKHLFIGLADAHIETYLFEEKEIDAVRGIFPVEPCRTKPSNNKDRKEKWFGIRAEIFQDMISAVHKDYIKNSIYCPLVQEWKKIGRDTGKNVAKFPDWSLFNNSISGIYPTKSTDMISGKMQWGTPIPKEFLTEDVYTAISKINFRAFTPQQINDFVQNKRHIGCGWIVLSQEPIMNEYYHTFTKAPSKPGSKPRQPRKQNPPKRKSSQDETSAPKRRKTTNNTDINQSNSSDPADKNNSEDKSNNSDHSVDKSEEKNNSEEKVAENQLRPTTGRKQPQTTTTGRKSIAMLTQQQLDSMFSGMDEDDSDSSSDDDSVDIGS